MPQTIQQRRALADRVHRAPVSISRRREQRANVIQWREEAKTQSAPTPAPAAPGEGTDPLISARLENLLLAGICCAVIVIADRSGLLAAAFDIIAIAVGVR